jgi:hypothetical protein
MNSFAFEIHETAAEPTEPLARGFFFLETKAMAKSKKIEVLASLIESGARNTTRIEFLEVLMKVGASRIQYSESEDSDDWGRIPSGFSIRVRACEEYDVSALTLADCIDKAIAYEREQIEFENEQAELESQS